MDGRFLMKATIVQICWSDVPAKPKLGMPVNLTPFLTTQKSSDGVLSFAITLRSAGTGFSPSDHLAQSLFGGPP